MERVMENENWKRQIEHSLRNTKDLPADFVITESEKNYFENTARGGSLGFSVTPYYFSLAENNPSDPIRRQFMPSMDEFAVKTYELEDPLGENRFSPCTRLIHRYQDRALLLVTDSCAVYCRHCFRRSFTRLNRGIISMEELGNVIAYLKRHDEIMELLISGGDPLMLDNQELEMILDRITGARKDLVLRVGTRAPVVLPQRIDNGLLSVLKSYLPLWVITQFNHPREITAQSRKAVSSLVDSGIPVLNQTVLLRGVNDDEDTLALVCRELVKIRVKPYYLFQGDLAEGTSHFRVPLKRGMKIAQELRRKVSGLALPVYAVDLPGGGGKVPLTESYFLKRENGSCYFKNGEGEVYKYPDE
ncbi:MAG: KamA family radical SAM protein [Spirochaetota bacterium]